MRYLNLIAGVYSAHVAAQAFSAGMYLPFLFLVALGAVNFALFISSRSP